MYICLLLINKAYKIKMVTNQLMERKFLNDKITQRTKDGFFNSSEFLKIYNKDKNVKKVIAEFWSNKNTKEFIKELENDILENIGNPLSFKTYETTKGRNGSTWMHPYLFIKFAMWLSSKFELQVIKWVHDNLIDFRNQAGDYYKEMCFELKEYYIRNNNTLKPDPLIYKNEAKKINYFCYGSFQSNQRNVLDEKKLELLNQLQKLNTNFLKNNIPSDERYKKLLDYVQSFNILNT